MLVTGKSFDEERAFYGLSDLTVKKCNFEGDADGESAFKETENVRVNECTFKLRYPFWHTKAFEIRSSEMALTCRAPLWYCTDGKINECTLFSPKALRECKGVTFENVTADSAEFCWNCKDVKFDKCDLSGEYMFFGTKGLSLSNVEMKGKYSFQYTENVTVENCTFDTKDAFWHAKNVTVKNCVIKGEYLGWYCENVKFVNCRIISTQPLCYCKNLILENCTMEEADRSFEYSDVVADIKGKILSVKNPLSGKIRADKIGEIINNAPVYECSCDIAENV